MKVTSAKKNPGRNNTLALYIDGEFAFDISEESYLKLALYEDKELSPVEVKRIKKLQNVDNARRLAFQYLQYKLRSEHEVYTRIVREGYDRSLAAAVVEDIKALGYLNDSIYVQKYLYDSAKLHPKSKRLLKRDLLLKGIDEDIIDKELSEWKMDDQSTAEVLVKKKFGKYDLNDEKIIRKIFYFLRHRGFSYDIIQKLINDLAKNS